jgi:hypothetical protein
MNNTKLNFIYLFEDFLEEIRVKDTELMRHKIINLNDMFIDQFDECVLVSISQIQSTKVICINPYIEVSKKEKINSKKLAEMRSWLLGYFCEYSKN